MSSGESPFSVVLGGQRVEVSTRSVEGVTTVTLLLFSDDPHNPCIERFTDDNGTTFRYKVFASPSTGLETDQLRIEVLRKALDAWRRRGVP